uniref:phosphotransferase n=1 Tax=Promicromonospora sp. CA-294714 TaxID=3240019 RepID=UPI003F49404A
MDDPATQSPTNLSHDDQPRLRLRGRNRISTTSIGDGRRVHVKHFVGDDAAERYRTTIAFDAWAGRHSFEHLRYAPIVDRSSDLPLVMTAWVSGAPLEYKDLVSSDVAEQPGTRALISSVSASLAELHDQEPLLVGGRTSQRLSIRERICRSASHLSVEAYTRSSAGVLGLWSTIHNDRALAGTIGTIADQSRQRGHGVPTHADFRLDQILWDPSSKAVTIVDWEEFRVDDPSLDLGSLLGELLFAALIESLGELAPTNGAERESEGEVRRATEEGVTVVQPATGLIWNAYANSRIGDLPDVEHVAQTIGLHLLDRVLAHATASHELSVLMRCVLGISRTAIMRPSVIVAALDLERP